MKSIPVDLLQHKTSIGLQIKVFGPDDQHKSKVEIHDAHRDDHYIFFLLTNGSGTLNVDLQHIVVAAGQLYYILPSQVHSHIKAERAEGWFVAVDPALIPPYLRDIFEQRSTIQVPCQLTDHELKQYSTLLNLLYTEFMERQGDKYYQPIIHSLGQSFLAMAASTYDHLNDTANKYNRSAEIARQFKDLLTIHSHAIKSPSVYASKLNVSPGYLNEAIKKVTGSTVSYWIQQEVFNEAKRLLYHSDADVKQIANELGYTDHSYFVRSFRKVAGIPPSKFRMLNRK